VSLRLEDELPQRRFEAIQAGMYYELAGSVYKFEFTGFYGSASAFEAHLIF